MDDRHAEIADMWVNRRHRRVRFPASPSHPNKIHKRLIKEFWDQFGGSKNPGRRFPPAVKLQALKNIAKKSVKYQTRQPLQRYRDRFNRVKHKRHQFRSHAECFVCGGSAECRHHIIPLSRGGINSKRNLVSLCNACHAKIHPWLK